MYQPRENSIFPYILPVLNKNIFVLNKNILLQNFHPNRLDFYKGELLRNRLPLCKQPILLWRGEEMAHILTNRASLLLYQNWHKAFFSQKDKYVTESKSWPSLRGKWLKSTFYSHTECARHFLHLLSNYYNPEKHGFEFQLFLTSQVTTDKLEVTSFLRRPMSYYNRALSAWPAVRFPQM